MSEDIAPQKMLMGIPGSPGICIGKAYLVDRENLDVVEKYVLDGGQVAEEVTRFKKAVKQAEDELARLIKRSPKEVGQHIYILEAHKALLKDKMFFGHTVDTIKKAKVNAEWALKTTLDRIRRVFNRVEDDYIRARLDDVVYVYNRVMRNLVGTQDSGIDKIDKRVILVAHDVSPAEASQIQLEWVKGFVTDMGGPTSHTSIIARTLQIPAVLGLENATKKIRTGDLIIVDGAAGAVILNPEEKTLLYYEQTQEIYEAYQARIARKSHFPAKTSDGVLIHVNGNIELLEEVVAALDRGGDGIGLYRTEFLYLNRRILPTEEELFENYKEVVEVMNPRPVTIRTLDVNGDKVAAGIMPDSGDNPALGLRAIRFCLKNPDIFLVQLRAILRASAFGHVRLLFPMISGVDELVQARHLTAQAAQELDRQGLAYDRELEVGAMIEVPSAAIIADMLAEHVDFFSIGTNDLIQYCLAVDRSNKQVAHLFQSLHPAVIRLIKRVADVSKDKGVRLAMCGEMAADPLNTPFLLGMGFDELSMNPQAIPAVKNAVRGLCASDCRNVVNDIMREDTAQAIARLILETYGDALPMEIPRPDSPSVKAGAA
jgi:phosphotransferase system enzyme I (PtsI)